MNKKVFAVILGAALSLTSCTEVLEANVNYTHSYTNDYSKLVEAINNLNSSLAERINALNTMLSEKLAGVSLSIDQNTGAINAQTTALKDSIGSLRVAIFDGFAALKTQQEENGEKLVTAINNNGELISAKLDKNNQLIETGVIGNLSQLNKTIASGDSTMAVKMDAMNSLIEGGLVKMDATNAELGKIGTSLNGIKTSVDGVNTSLESIDGSLGKLNTSIEGTNGKLESLNTSIGNLNTNVKDLSTQLSEDFVSLGTSIKDNSQLIVKAINKEGEVLTLGFEKTNANLDALNGKINTSNANLVVISTKLENLNTSISSETSGIPALINAQKLISASINNLNTQEKANAKTIADAIEKLLNDEGIYTPTDGSKDKLYMTYSAYAELTAAGSNTDVYKNIMNSIKEYEVEVVHAQKAANYTGTGYGMPDKNSAFYGSNTNYSHYHDHCNFTPTSKDGETLVAGNYGVNANSGTTRKTYEVIHTYDKIIYSASLHDCSHVIASYAIKDARGIVKKEADSKTTQSGIEMKAAYNGTIVSEIQLIVYGANASYQDFDFTYNTSKDTKTW